MLERSSNSPQARSKAQQAAEEQFDRDDDDYAALVVGFTEGWEAALPENPDPAVIEVMARAIYGDQHKFSDWDSGRASSRDNSDAFRQARAAYAALRGAMQ